MLQGLGNRIILCGSSWPCKLGGQRVPGCVGGEGAASGLQLGQACIIKGTSSLYLNCCLLQGLSLAGGKPVLSV